MEIFAKKTTKKPYRSTLLNTSIALSSSPKESGSYPSAFSGKKEKKEINIALLNSLGHH